MTDPTLKRTSVQIKYTASDGYQSEFGVKGGTGTKHRVTGDEVPPEEALFAAIYELSRLAALFEFEERARVAFDEAAAAVNKWSKEKP